MTNFVTAIYLAMNIMRQLVQRLEDICRHAVT